MEMAESTYWDKTEFNFFETLEDDDKLLYLYDLMIGDFSYISIHNEMEELDKQEKELSEMFRQLGEAADERDDTDGDVWDFETERSEVKVEFVRDTECDYIKISGPTLDILLKVASDLQMNGMMLMDKNIEFTKYEPWHVILSYRIIGNAPPFSVN